ncbi:MAG: hypothetical protein V7K35_06905 [Nostoc sp.]|uniref:hypothetical protein n=1 Tax=Nostoc sp. TaxID=1180 RepID=UPI002FFD2E61
MLTFGGVNLDEMHAAKPLLTMILAIYSGRCMSGKIRFYRSFLGKRSHNNCQM